MAIDRTPPEVDSKNLAEFFTKTYLVPSYQRNYSWTPVEVKQLLTDLFEYFDDASAPYYLLGDVIVVDSGDTDYAVELIDGQQRTTTLVLLFAVIYKYLVNNSFDEEELLELRPLLKKNKKIRVKMSGNGSDSVKKYINGLKPSELDKTTPSQRNIVSALETIESQILEKFGEDKPGSVHDFFTKVKDTVYLSRLSLVNASAAFQFFERVNDRGRPLSKTDLLKNRLLQNIKSDEDFETATDVWSEAEKKLLKFGREGSMNYLLRNVLIADLNTKVKESEIYDLWKPFVSDEAMCNKLIDRIQLKAIQLANILDGKTPSGESDNYTFATKYMRFTQNYGIKLAGGGLDAAVFDQLSKRLEIRAILSLFALERSQTYESLATTWAHNVQKLDLTATDSDVCQEVRVTSQDLDDLLNRAKAAIQGLRYGKTPGQTARIRLLLAIINFELQSLVNVYHYKVEDLLTTSKKVRGVDHPGYDIEHVGASSTAGVYLADMLDSLGNLTLFHSKDNRSQGNNQVEFKALDYSNSICFATKILSAIPSNDPDLEAVLGPLRVNTVDAGVWSTDQVEARFEFYWNQFESYIRKNLVTT